MWTLGRNINANYTKCFSLPQTNKITRWDYIPVVRDKLYLPVIWGRCRLSWLGCSMMWKKPTRLFGFYSCSSADCSCSLSILLTPKHVHLKKKKKGKEGKDFWCFFIMQGISWTTLRGCIWTLLWRMWCTKINSNKMESKWGKKRKKKRQNGKY